MKYTLKTLPNNIKLLTVPMPSLESATVTVWVGVGSRFEPDAIGGISHFIEHMAFKGSKKYKTAQEVSETIDAMGADYNAATSREWTNFFIKSRTENLDKAFDVLSDMILYPALNEFEIEKERGVILEEIAMQDDSPMEKIGDIFMELVFLGSPLARDIAGSKESVRKISKKDFTDFRNLHYHGGNIVITVAGGIDEDEVQKLAEKYFYEVEAGPKEIPSPFVLTQDAPKLKVEYKKSEQAHFILGFMGHGRNYEKRYAENVLATILGRGMSSRLFSEIREKRGLAYSVSTSISRYVDTGIFETYAGVDLKRIDEAIGVMLDQHYGIVSEKFPIADYELTKAKEYMKGTTALALEDTMSICNFFGQRVLFSPSEIETPKKIFEKIDAVTKDEVLAVAKELFVPAKLNLSIIGPFKNPEKFSKIIGK
jgi:predicted Zn-dependent peptidase